MGDEKKKYRISGPHIAQVERACVLFRRKKGKRKEKRVNSKKEQVRGKTGRVEKRGVQSYFVSIAGWTEYFFLKKNY